MGKYVKISIKDFEDIEEKIKKLEAQVELLLKANKRYEEQVRLVNKLKKDVEMK